ncbi:hypothetical protein AAMO2058_000437100 [Amorphochlora amoebiformis]
MATNSLPAPANEPLTSNATKNLPVKSPKILSKLQESPGKSPEPLRDSKERDTKALSKAATRLQALFRGRHARKTHVPMVKSGKIWGPPVWMKPKAIHDMLTLANAGPKDILYDLGSGHGDIVIASVKHFDVKQAIGIEVDLLRVKTAKRMLAHQGISENRAKIIHGGAMDAKKYGISMATIVTCFMSPDAHQRSLRMITQNCRDDTRIVFYAFPPTPTPTPNPPSRAEKDQKSVKITRNKTASGDDGTQDAPRQPREMQKGARFVKSISTVAHMTEKGESLLYLYVVQCKKN